MKFGMDLMSLGSALNFLFFQFPTIHNISKADEGTCEVVSTLVQFTTGAYDLTKVRSHDPLRTILYFCDKVGFEPATFGSSDKHTNHTTAPVRLQECV
jgi:hypothetical protein